MAELRLAPRSSDSQARALSTTLHCLLKPLTGEKTEAQRGLFFWDSLGQAEREGGREGEKQEGGEAWASPHPDFHKNVAGAMDAGVWVGLGVGHSLPGTNSDLQRTAGLLAINIRLRSSD